MRPYEEYIHDARSYEKCPHKEVELARKRRGEHRDLVIGSAYCAREYVRRSSKSTLEMECQRQWRVQRVASSRRHSPAWHTFVFRTGGKKNQGKSGTPEKHIKTSFTHKSERGGTHGGGCQCTGSIRKSIDEIQLNREAAIILC